MSLNNCNLCYNDFDDIIINESVPNYLIKCSECSCQICVECSQKWFINNKKKDCPQCRRSHTFDIDNPSNTNNYIDNDLKNLILQLQLIVSLTNNNNIMSDTIPRRNTENTEDLILNEATGYYVSKNGATGKKIIMNKNIEKAKKELVKSEDNTKVFNPDTNRWVSAHTNLGKKIINKYQSMA